MKYTILLMMLALVACGNNKNVGKASENVLIVHSLTKQDNFPGVESNLRFTRTYTCIMHSELMQSFQPQYLLVDSVQLPIKSFQRNGTLQLVDNGATINPGDTIQFITNRMYYNADSRNNILEEMTYASSGIMLADSLASLRCLTDSGVIDLSLGTIEARSSIYNP
ncbi:MAG: hypothetical protein KDC12_07510 [Flavobacteriales bacterium]|nr:hypothetical protein [Flavobacteriales bacterium]